MQIEHRAVELEASGLELGIVENVVQHRMQALRRLLQGLGIAPLRGVEPGVEQKLGHGDHRAERGAELVAHHGDQLGLGPVGGLSLYALLPLGLDRLDKALDLRKEIVRPEIFRFHAFRSTRFPSFRQQFQKPLKSWLNLPGPGLGGGERSGLASDA